MACGLFSVGYTAIASSYAVFSAVIPEGVFAGLLMVAVLLSAWANMPLASKIGWSQGGFPIFFFLASAAIILYALAAAVIGMTVVNSFFPEY